MQHKQTPYRSIDGFMPKNDGAPRRVGFDAPRKPLALQNTQSAVPKVGQTLASYAPTSTIGSSSGLSARRPLNTQLDDDIKEPIKTKPKKRLWGKKAAQPSKSKRGFMSRFLTWRRLLLLVCIIVLAIGGWLGFKFIYNASKTFNGGLFSVLGSTKLKGEDVGRVNILLAGNSADDVGHNGGKLTDSIMIISLDTKNKSAYMLSIPRDLYVSIPDNGYAKINEAYVDGENDEFNKSGYFPGGMGLLQQTVEENFNINLNYYALVNYTALRDMVNAVGGIDYTVKSSDPRGLYDSSIDYTTRGPLVKLKNGTHTLNGQQALNLARARGDGFGSYGFPASDFDRTNNQRQELLALKSKVTTTGVLANPAKISSIFDAVGSNIKTDLTLGEVRRAYDIGKDITNIQSVGLNSVKGKNLLMSYATPTGQSALVPAAGLDDFSDIQAAIKQLTSNNPITREGANVVVLNATDVTGVAGRQSRILKAKGVIVGGTGDAVATQTTTSIIDLSEGKMNGTKTLLQSLYGKTLVSGANYASIYYEADFIVLIGTDKATPPDGTTPASTTQ